MVPVFGCMLAGFMLIRYHLIDSSAVDMLNRLIYYAAFPALLFSFLARTSIDRIWQASFINAWLLSLAAIYCFTFLVSRLFWGTDRTAATVRALNCSCGNTAWMGIPLLVNAYGQDGVLLAILATTAIMTVLLSLTIAYLELAHDSIAPGRALTSVAYSLARNPLILAVTLGVISSAFLDLPRPVIACGELLGSAAVPCSLLAIGMYIAGRPLRQSADGVMGPVIIKLVAHPLVTWVIVRWIIPLEPTSASAAILLAALPTATSCFVVAKNFDILVTETSTTIGLSTALSGIPIVFVLFATGLQIA